MGHHLGYLQLSVLTVAPSWPCCLAPAQTPAGSTLPAAALTPQHLSLISKQPLRPPPAALPCPATPGPWQQEGAEAQGCFGDHEPLHNLFKTHNQEVLPVDVVLRREPGCPTDAIRAHPSSWRCSYSSPHRKGGFWKQFMLLVWRTCTQHWCFIANGSLLHL